jgi:hypothetical protein
MSLPNFFTSSIFWIIFTVVIVAICIAAPIIFMRVIRNSYGSGSVKNGVTASATITRMWDTGTTINDSPLVGLELQVNPPNGAPFTVECKQMVNRLQVGYFQPGQTITISYDPANPKKLHIIEVGAANAEAAGMAGAQVAAGIPGMPAQATPAAIELQLQQIDAANEVLMATGQSASAQVTSYMDWNVHVNGENPAVTLMLQVNPPGKPPFLAQASGVIAVASVPKYQPGCTIWVKYDPNNLTKVTIDHS